MSNLVYAPINHYSSQVIMDLFDACYKLGVKDAIEVDNEMQCIEFCENMYNSERFGRIIFNYVYSWREWKFRLCQMMCDLEKYRVQGLKFFESITSYGNYLACALPIAMDFYMMGIKDYCKKPNPNLLIRFERIPYAFWGNEGGRKTTREDFVTILTGFCYDRIRLDEFAIQEREKKIAARRAAENEGRRGRFSGKRISGPIGLTRASYESFQAEIWRNTRRSSY